MRSKRDEEVRRSHAFLRVGLGRRDYLFPAIKTTGPVGEAKRDCALTAQNQRARLKLHATGPGLGGKGFTMHSFGVGAAVSKNDSRAGCAIDYGGHWMENSRDGQEIYRRSLGKCTNGRKK